MAFAVPLADVLMATETELLPLISELTSGPQEAAVAAGELGALGIATGIGIVGTGVGSLVAGATYQYDPATHTLTLQDHERRDILLQTGPNTTGPNPKRMKVLSLAGGLTRIVRKNKRRTRRRRTRNV